MKHWKQIKQIIFDADDTLWENNMFYVQASSDFFDLMVQAGLERSRLEQDFDELELWVVQKMGYGSANFVYILEELFKRYQQPNGHKPDEQAFRKIVKRFSDHPTGKPKLFPDVVPTLNRLKHKYEIYILTKGEYSEQQGKIIRAGVDKIACGYFIPPEKNDHTYRDLLTDQGWLAAETCMVGNSPKSDINPALRQGMYAIHIPYRDTWKLDDEPICAVDGRFLELENFEKLIQIFL